MLLCPVSHLFCKWNYFKRKSFKIYKKKKVIGKNKSRRVPFKMASAGTPPQSNYIKSLERECISDFRPPPREGCEVQPGPQHRVREGSGR